MVMGTICIGNMFHRGHLELVRDMEVLLKQLDRWRQTIVILMEEKKSTDHCTIHIRQCYWLLSLSE